jgi:hypothetical protein
MVDILTLAEVQIDEAQVPKLQAGSDGMIMSQRLQRMMRDVLRYLSQNRCMTQFSDSTDERWSEMFKGTSLSGYAYEIEISGGWQDLSVSFEAYGAIPGQGVLIASNDLFVSRVLAELRHFFYEMAEKASKVPDQEEFDVIIL